MCPLLVPVITQGEPVQVISSFLKAKSLSCNHKFHRKDAPFPQMRALTHDGEAVPWSQSDDLLRTRFCPSSDDCDKNFFRPPCRTDTMLNQTSVWPGWANCRLFSHTWLHSILPLLKSNFLSVPRWTPAHWPLYICLLLPNRLSLDQYPFSAFIIMSLKLTCWAEWHIFALLELCEPMLSP